MVDKIKPQQLPEFPPQTQQAINNEWKKKRDALVEGHLQPKLVAAIDEIAATHLGSYRQAWQAEKAIQELNKRYSLYRKSDDYKNLPLEEQRQYESVHGSKILSLMELKNRQGIEESNLENVRRLMEEGDMPQAQALQMLGKIIGQTLASHNSQIEESDRMRVTGKRRLFTELAQDETRNQPRSK